MAVRHKLVITAAALISPVSIHAETLESFQTGPLGDGYGYSVISGLQSEVQLKTTNEFGKSTFDSIPNEKISSNTIKTQMSTATAFRASSDFYIIGYTDFEIVSHSQEARIDSSELNSGANSYEFGAKAIYEKGAFTFGGKFGLLNFGGESRELKTAGRTYKSEAGWASIPQLEILGGYKWKNTTNMARFKFYSQGEYEVETRHDRKGIIYDSYRKVPAELSLSSLVDFNHQLQVGASVRLIAAKQASQTTDQWSAKFTNTGRRVVSGNNRDINQVVLTAGGKFFPTSSFAVASSVSYETTGYENENTASLESDNFGGLSFNFSSEFIPDPKSRIHASTSYKIPTSIEFKKTSSTANVLSHQSITTGAGSNSTTSVAEFSLALGGTYMF
jgi:hypothetical protein